MAARGAASGGAGSGADHLQCGQRCRGDLDVFAGGSAIWIHAAVVADSHDHRAVRDRRDVRAHGGGDRQGAFGFDSRGVWISADVLRDGHGFSGGFGKRGGRIRRRGVGDGNFRSEPLHRRSAGGTAGVGAGAAGHLPAGGKGVSGAVHVLSDVYIFGNFGEAELAGCGAPYCYSFGAIQLELSVDADGPGGHDDRALAILLSAGGLRRETGGATPVHSRRAPT